MSAGRQANPRSVSGLSTARRAKYENVTMRSVRVTTFAVEKHKVLTIMSASVLLPFFYPACNRHLFSNALRCCLSRSIIGFHIVT